MTPTGGPGAPKDPSSTRLGGPGRPNKEGEPKKGKPGIPLLITLILIVLIVGQVIDAGRWKQIPQSEFEKMLVDKTVEEVTIDGTTVKVIEKAEQGKDPRRFVVQLPNADAVTSLNDRLLARSAEAKSEGRTLEVSSAPQSGWAALLIYVLPFVALLALFWFLMRKMGPPQGVMNFGKSKARIYAEKEVHVTFADVAGCEEAVEEVREIVEFLKEPKKFQALGARIPKGVLLLGSPGTGKTLLARAVAGEAGVPFFSLSGSDFVEMFVGVGASRVRDLFQQAEQQAPSLVFIDELDALGKTRGSSPVSNDEREQTLNALLVEMDGFSPNNGVIIIAATNRPEILDPALLRPGRFDRQVVVDRPDVVGRQRILEVHAKKVRLDPAVELLRIAKRTPGFVGADLANVINEAALLAARRNRKAVLGEDIEEAIDRVMIGLKKQRRGMTQRDKEITAAHEAGHAVACHFTKGNDPVHRISIIPRGPSTGGVTMSFPEEERGMFTREELTARIVWAFGGRVAEQLIYEHVSTGASSDLEQATRYARYMITRYGMSERAGPVSLEAEGATFLRDPFARSDRSYSEATQRIIDEEIRELLLRCEKTCTEVLLKHRDALDRVRAVLVEKEVLEREEFERIVGAREAA